MNRIFFLLVVVAAFVVGCSPENPPGPSFEEQLQKDVKEIDEYLLTNAITATSDPSGIRYLVSQEGQGEQPGPNDLIYVSVKGKILKTGQVFVDASDRFTDVPLGVSDLLVSWKTVIPKMKKGSSFTIFSPSGFAYGNLAVKIVDVTVPANTNVIFEMKLFDEVDQFKIDTAAISDFLDIAAINAVKDPSGIRYVISSPGTGPKPIASSTITFNYEGKLLATGATFDKSTTAPLTLALTNIIKGLQIGFPLLGTGGKATFYIPSSLGYGPVNNNAIPGNSNLIFEVELVSLR
jgi:FKBP-type peptidyl-prolyl cis-trans isomerase